MRRAAWLAPIACAALFGLDRALAHVAVEMNAAGALLSPGGAELEALAVGLGFLLVRLTFVASVGVTAFVLVGSALAPARSE